MLCNNLGDTLIRQTAPASYSEAPGAPAVQETPAQIAVLHLAPAKSSSVLLPVVLGAGALFLFLKGH